jgi:epoxide hydrolase-like predicted phosphatase
MITTVIFDIGNVLVEFSWRKHYELMGFDEAMIERLAKATVRNPGWNEYDRGVLSEEETIQGFVDSDPEIEDDIRRALKNIRTMIKRCDYAIPWIQDLKKKGYRCLYLSNFSHKAETECAEALDFIPYMDGGILSYRDKVIKPQPEIYDLLIERYQLVPEECVFLDDTLPNVEAARKAGMHAIHFKNREQALEELKALGVN